ncbi:hypothetical protein CW745_05935 [Psychromonas sp. psych-6C06]|uniref:hypothetical protein n=1 Tax=Psychromonas sp. psych-6C06 TaxID=2058089 RepID=UPI000C31E51E|nr:hypothetical protein [Psychromonas sp. psych-6C06]PKF62963.1 hypothetical protein CW745_05935 [Psychromonas sp. psych-6C06]
MNKFSYSKLEKLFNQMTLRERFTMFSALIICTFLIAYFWIIDPATIQQAKLQRTLQKSVQAEKVINNEIEMINKRLQEDPLKEINNKIAFSQATLVQLDKQLDEKLVKFIHAQKMPIALTKVLSKSPGVRISALTSLPVKVFNADKGATEEVNKSPFYQHTLQITLQGDYNAIYQYLLNVESIPEKFYWHSLNYKVSNYPLAEVTLKIYTLSDQQDLVSG